MTERVPIIIVGALLVLLGAFLFVVRWPALWDPCQTWDDHSSEKTVSAGDPCASSSSTTLTRGQFIATGLAGEGVLLVGGALAIWGGSLRSPWRVGAAGLAMASPVVVLFLGLSALFVLPLTLGVVLIALALYLRRVQARRVEGPGPSA